MKTSIDYAKPKSDNPFPCVRANEEGTFVVMFTHEDRAIVLKGEGADCPGDVLEGSEEITPFSEPGWYRCAITLDSRED